MQHEWHVFEHDVGRRTSLRIDQAEYFSDVHAPLAEPSKSTGLAVWLAWKTSKKSVRRRQRDNITDISDKFDVRKTRA